MSFLWEPGERVNTKRVARLRQGRGLQARASGPPSSRSAPENPIAAYRRGGVKIEQRDQVESCAITSLPLPQGVVCLFAVLAWESR